MHGDLHRELSLMSKITHLAFSPEIMGADILEKLSLTAEVSFPQLFDSL